jgi:hypothetical protein
VLAVILVACILASTKRVQTSTPGCPSYGPETGYAECPGLTAA